MKRINQILGERLRTLRERTGLSQEEFAVRGGLSQAHQSRLEAGRGWKSMITVAEVMTANGIDPAELLVEGDEGDALDAELRRLAADASPEAKRAVITLLRAVDTQKE